MTSAAVDMHQSPQKPFYLVQLRKPGPGTSRGDALLHFYAFQVEGRVQKVLIILDADQESIRSRQFCPCDLPPVPSCNWKQPSRRVFLVFPVPGKAPLRSRPKVVRGLPGHEPGSSLDAVALDAPQLRKLGLRGKHPVPARGADLVLPLHWGVAAPQLSM